ncbi:Lysophospholipase, alpha-beta hydrolase superfamily [Actinopolyspora lacussalsi subsp. righensis]|uniref:Lysophospholipase, alpha-beta hydrolase superfamily n=1 Tax=Actinopolyspora righensis TaxID=995060 RepID=A0A1I6Z9R2_9ACTN|nr:alpha/beta hydrolase [Actinopolyspora righensis]SFT59408.1 Lysophospholipase, alpha-beta hydrolase superfamily [Actinopolyspora righensis]
MFSGSRARPPIGPVEAVPGYLEHTYWLRYQEFFPGALRSTTTDSPTEHWWSWRGVPLHLDVVRRDDAAAKLLMLHGIGGYGRMLAPYAKLPSLAELEYVAPDLPGHGLSSAVGSRLTYRHWVDCVIDLIAAERVADPRPVVLFGMGLGGWLAYQVAARVPDRVVGLVVTSLADPRGPEVRDGLVANPGAGLLSEALARIPVLPAPHRVPLHWLLDITAVSGNARLAATYSADELGGAAAIPLRLFRSYLRLPPAVSPANFTAPPLLLASPEADRWTPGVHSERFLGRLNAPKRSVLLPESGHLPGAEPALAELDRAVRYFFEEFRIPH